MVPVESQILAYIQRRLSAGSLDVSESEIMDAVIPIEHPEYRRRPAYRYGLRRLHVRGVINAIDDHKGMRHYFIGSCPSPELYEAMQR